MKLHVFNPEHDIALAINKGKFTPPRAVQKLRADLGFIPALWAENGDLVLVDDVETAEETVRYLPKYAKKVRFVSTANLLKEDFASSAGFEVEPWGWDLSIRCQLLDANPSLCPYLPTMQQISEMRRMSSRQFAAEHLLPQLVSIDERLVGKSLYCEDLPSVMKEVRENGKSVLKSPWSCSGRGVRYVGGTLTEHQQGWVNNVIRRQGGIMVEPLYRKVMNFGMEFMARKDGTIDYSGLSMFNTSNGAYTGSILATEDDKRTILLGYVDGALHGKMCERIKSLLPPLFAGKWHGPFGVDMMIVATDNTETYLVHPCVEMNLRRTMGHVALAISPSSKMEPQGVMTISFSGRYRLHIHKA